MLTTLPRLFHIFSWCGAKHRNNFTFIPYKNMLEGTGLKLMAGYDSSDTELLDLRVSYHI